MKVKVLEVLFNDGINKILNAVHVLKVVFKVIFGKSDSTEINTPMQQESIRF